MPKKVKPRRNEKVTISFTEADLDIVEFLEEYRRNSKASEFIREAIREKMNRKFPALEENVSIAKFNELEDRVSILERLILQNSPRLSISGANTLVSGESAIKEDIIDEKKEEIDENILNAVDYFDF